MSTGIVILARMDSRRLPGKVLRPLGGQPILGHVIERCLRARGADEVIVATTDRDVDDAVAEFAGERVAVYRGATNDVARRCLDCAAARGHDRLCRISADSPFVDPELVTRLIRLHRAHDLDIATNVAPRSFPYGISAEVVSLAALRRILAETDDPADREHVTRYIYRHPEAFRLRNVTAPDRGYLGLRLVIDTADDLRRAEWIVSRLAGPAAEASLDELAVLARQWEAAQGLAS